MMSMFLFIFNFIFHSSILYINLYFFLQLKFFKYFFLKQFICSYIIKKLCIRRLEISIIATLKGNFNVFVWYLFDTLIIIHCFLVMIFSFYFLVCICFLSLLTVLFHFYKNRLLHWNYYFLDIFLKIDYFYNVCFLMSENEAFIYIFLLIKLEKIITFSNKWSI